jgi:parallel beta-helix repeat protein
MDKRLKIKEFKNTVDIQIDGVKYMNKFTAIIIFGVLILIQVFPGCIEDLPGEDIYVDISGSKSYTSIQNAIDNVTENGTVHVLKGIYYENLIINKTVNLIGADKENTIIDARYNNDTISIIGGNGGNISGFTIRNSGNNTSPNYNAGINIQTNDNIIKNNIFINNICGIFSKYVRENEIIENIFTDNREYGIYLFSGSSETIIKENRIISNKVGVRIKGSMNCIIEKNLFKNNKQGFLFCCSARSNSAYHNTFINNSDWSGQDNVGNNNWDNGYPSGGNYWDDYTGLDNDMDGIGDIPYNTSKFVDTQDRYPLMTPMIS